MTAILGISAFYHDSAAALVVDGKVVAAAQEERFSRVKHDAAFPQQSIEFCLAESGLARSDIDYVVFYEKPLLKFERLLKTYVSSAPAGYGSFRKAMPVWLKQKLHVRREIKKRLGDSFRGRCVFTEHHQSHAASAFFPSPFEQSAILTMDGVGEWATTCSGVGRGNQIEMRKEIRFPHSLGLLYSAFTYYCGFRVNHGEYKLMGLAPYGEPRFKDIILDRLIDLKPDGSFRLDMRYFDYCRGLRMTNSNFDELFGGQRRQPESELTQRERDLAASVQVATEEIALRIVRDLHKHTAMKNLVLAGGVALNCVANARIHQDGPFDNVWVPPASGDDGGALGAALFVWHQLLNNSRNENDSATATSVFLGPEFSSAQSAKQLSEAGAVFTTLESDEALVEQVADALAQQKIVGWFQGRMEFSPRALGARSILADARDPATKSKLNETIKFREAFRPFAPVVLAEKSADWFELAPDQDHRCMTFVASVREAMRERIPSVVHVNGTARLQTVAAESGLFHRLLKRFDDRTDCPVVVNTSFNVRGQPIVGTPTDAYRCFAMTDMDILVVGHHVINKSDQPQASLEQARQECDEELRSQKKSSHLFQDVVTKPTDAQLRWFASGFLVMFPLLAWLWGRDRNIVASCAAAGVLLAGMGWLAPSRLKPLFIGLGYLTAPASWLLREIALLIVFAMGVLPVGLAFRALKIEALAEIKRDRVESYWKDRDSENPKRAATYYRQF